ncbi:hypothetical protein FRC18_006479 [Serendipita sp. 400]|nr:hypothetical protein FRC18_006479 [Serendipita sp. 400]
MTSGGTRVLPLALYRPLHEAWIPYTSQLLAPSSRYNGTIQTSVSGSADSNILSQSVIIGIAFSAFV